jgi:hypothetical protein
MIERGGDRNLLEAAVRGSFGGRLGTALAAVFSRAWSSSRSARVVAAVTAAWRAQSPVVRIRMIALAGATGMLVHLAMLRLGEPQPLGAVVPLLVVVACGALALCAGPLARAGERFNR